MSSAHRSPSARRPRSGRLRGALLLLALAVLPACMQVPDSGPVHAGPEVSSGDEPVLRYVPSGPQPGDDPVGVVNGYLDAMRAYPPNPATVRQFLTRAAAASWTPAAGTQIYTARPDIERVGAETVRIEGRLRAALTDRGTWTTPPPGERRLTRVFHVRRVGGEWRIADPAPGLLLPEYDFERYYRAYSLYFFDPALRVLVPSQVYLPQGGQTPTLLLRGLVRGPTEWLGGAVESMLPPTDRADVSVPVTDGVAQVQLGAAARGLGAAERERLAAQLAWTLRQVPDVDAVRVTVNGAPLALEDGSNLVDVDDAGADFDPADPAAAQTLYALHGDHVVTLDQAAGLSRRIAGRFGSGAVPVSTFAVERSGQTVAAVTAGGSRVEVAPMGAQQSQVWFEDGSSLFDLQWDIHGLLWALDRTRSGTAVHVLREGRAASVELRGDAPQDISAFALARDGVRVAVVTGRGESSRLLLGRVRRPADDSSMPLAIDGWREVGGGASRLHGFVDVAWESPTELTVVAEQEAGSRQVFTVSVDGSAVEPAFLLELDIASVADAPDLDRPTVVATRPGSLYVRLADRWSELALQGVYREPSYVE